ncbi:hypothetical protein GW765_04090 [Candidatus Parcubacteria bacterium]|nr:hypothetical protein [Candidatus Parcubacteria bacterium]
MKSNIHKSSFHNFLSSPLALLASVVLFGIVVYSFVSVIPKQKRSQEARVESQNELGDLEEKKASLEQEIGLLSSDFGREKALREKFGVVKEGEEIIVLVNNEEEVEKEVKAGLFGWISGLFSGK